MPTEKAVKLADLLEKKREQLAEGITVFARRVFPDLTERSACALYRQIKNVGRPFPKRRFAAVAELLEISVSEIEALGNSRPREKSFGNLQLTSEELRCMADITAAAGKPLPMSLLLEVLNATK